MPFSPSLRRCGRFAIVILVTCTILLGDAAPARAAAPASPANKELINYLDLTLRWYHDAQAIEPSATDPNEIYFRNSVEKDSVQIVRLGFEFGEAEALMLTPANGNPSSNADTKARMTLAANTASQRVSQIQTQIEQAGLAFQKASPETLPTLTARRDELQAELNLAKDRLAVLQKFVQFMNAPGSGGNGGLLEQVQAMELPEATPDRASKVLPLPGQDQTAPDAAPAPKQTAAPDDSAPGFHPESAGIIGLVSQMFTLTRRMEQVKRLESKTQELSKQNEKLRKPLTADLLDAIRHGDQLTSTQPSDDAARLDLQKQQLNTLDIKYQQLSASLVPLREQGLIIDSVQANVAQWRESLTRQYEYVLRYLLFRLGAMAAAILILIGISTIWRRATFRYVTDVRRRRQFLVVRRIVVSCIIIIILIAGIVTEFGSLATFAGLITAGIAVALQSVILSGFAYFFFIGRYGVRVGDRVTVSGITGDVMDIGLFRIYLMELTGGGRDQNPTGRIVVFSNSVLFQGNAFFKQIPGSDYVWHELALTLSPDSDIKLAETRLMDAVNAIFADYHATIEDQQKEINRAFHLQLPTPRPQGRLRLVDAGLEFVVRYPVQIPHAADTDDKITRALLDTIAKEPNLQLCVGGTPKIQKALP